MARSAIERRLVAGGFGVAATDLEVHAIVAAVAPKSYQTLAAETINCKLISGRSFVDVKAGFDEAASAETGVRVWRL